MTRQSSTASCRRDTRTPYDVREVIARLVDGSDFDEFKARYGTTLVCGFAHLHGYPVGILANNGILFSRVGPEGRAFHRAVRQRSIPLVFLQNITGFMVGRKYEDGGIAKDGAKMVTAVATRQGAEVHRDHRRQSSAPATTACAAAPTPALPLDVAERPHLGDGRRAGGQCAGHGQARWHRSARRELDGRGGRGVSSSRSVEQYEQQGHPYYATARLWDDGVIDPAQTREVLGAVLVRRTSMRRSEPTRFGVFRM